MLAAAATAGAIIFPKPPVSVDVVGAQAGEYKTSQHERLLKDAIDGSVFETGKKDSAGKYEIYKYDGLGLDGCLLRWREDRQVYEARRRSLREQLEISVPLSIINIGSIRTDKIGNSGYVVLMMTRGRKTAIAERGYIVYNDGDEIKNDGLSTNTGIYFSDFNRAQKFVRSAISLIRYCSAKSRPRQG